MRKIILLSLLLITGCAHELNRHSCEMLAKSLILGTEYVELTCKSPPSQISCLTVIYIGKEDYRCILRRSK